MNLFIFRRQSEIEELEGGDVKPQRRYSDVDTTKLFQATADVLGERTEFCSGGRCTKIYKLLPPSVDSTDNQNDVIGVLSYV